MYRDKFCIKTINKSLEQNKLSMAPLLLLSLLWLFELLYAYSEWDDQFDHNTYVTPDENFLIYWTTDIIECKIEFGLVVETSGWAAIGISSTGGMSKSDMVVGYIDDNGDAVLENWYRDSNGNGPPDGMFSDQSGIELVDAWKEEVDGVTTLYIHFIKDIFPSADREYAIDIPIGTAKVIYAWRDDLQWTYHGAGQRGTEAMNLIAGDSQEVSLPDDADYYDVLQPAVQVPSDDTTYWCE